MIYGEATTTVTASAEQVLDFVADLHRYRQADTKIRKVLDVSEDGADVVVRFRSRLRGLPTPAVRQRIVRTGDQRLGITSEPSWQDRVVRFRGSVTCTTTRDGSTQVTHREEFHAHRLIRPLFERFLGGWLSCDVSAEVDRLGRLLGRPAAAAESLRRQ